MSEARRAVAVAAVALLLSAALLSAFGGSGAGGGSGPSGSDDGAGDRRAGEDGVSLSELLEPLLDERSPEDERRRRDSGTPPEDGSDEPPQVQPRRGSGDDDASGGIVGRLAELLRGVLGPGNTAANGTLDRPDRLQLYVIGETVPGGRVTLYVVDGDGPAAGVPLYVNGEYAGRTDDRGRLDVRVPYAAEMNVTTGPPPESDGNGSGADADPGAPVATVVWIRPPVALAGSATGAGQSTANDTDGNGTVGRQIDLPTDANVSVVGDPGPGATVTLVATVAGEPFRGANVRVDGERIGRTDRTGRIDHTFGRVRFAEVTVERGATSGRQRVAVQPVNLTLRGLAIPGQPVTARVTLRGDPLAGVPVRFDGERVGRTDADGEVRARVPVENRLAVTARTDAGVPVRRVVDWMLLPFALVPLAAAGIVAGGRYADRRTERGLGAATRDRVARAIEAALAALVAGTSRLENLAAAAARLLVAVRARLGRAAGKLRAGTKPGLEPGDVRAFGRRLLAALCSRLRGWLSRAGAVRPGGEGHSATPPRAVDSASDRPTDGIDADHGPRERVRAAWRQVLTRAGIRRRHVLSPGEARDRALAADPEMPDEAVDSLTEAFRAVEYGDADPGEVLGDVRDAARRIGDDSAGTGAATRDGDQVGNGNEDTDEEGRA